MSYATIAQLLDRKSPLTIGDLVSDTSEPVLAADLASNTRVQAALDAASGAIEAALLAGNRYSADDLAALTGNSAAYLVMICCDLAMANLFARKPTYDAEAYKTALEVADMHLKPLRQGEHVFDIQAVKDAGVPSVSTPTVPDLNDLNLLRDRTLNYYPARRL